MTVVVVVVVFVNFVVDCEDVDVTSPFSVLVTADGTPFSKLSNAACWAVGTGNDASSE